MVGHLTGFTPTFSLERLGVLLTMRAASLIRQQTQARVPWLSFSALAKEAPKSVTTDAKRIKAAKIPQKKASSLYVFLKSFTSLFALSPDSLRRMHELRTLQTETPLKFPSFLPG